MREMIPMANVDLPKTIKGPTPILAWQVMNIPSPPLSQAVQT